MQDLTPFPCVTPCPCEHLHSLGGCYQGVRIVTPAEAAELLQAV